MRVYGQVPYEVAEVDVAAAAADVVDGDDVHDAGVDDGGLDAEKCVVGGTE